MGGRLPTSVFRPWRSFPTMVASGLAVGLATGGFPAYSRELSQLFLIVAMTFSLTEISFAGISPRAELRGLLLSLGLSYGLLSGLLLVYAALSPEPAIHDGWVLMAAVPPAVAVVPITSYLRGDTRRSLISLALLYLLGLALVPGITIAFTHESVPVGDLVLQTVLLIGLPMAISRPLRRWRRTNGIRGAVVSVSFFVLVIAIAGSTRDQLLGRPELLASLALLAFGRTFAVGGGTLAVAKALRAARDEQVAAAAFASFKNLGLTVVLAFAVFDPLATLPSIVSLVFEILWLAALPGLFRVRALRPSTSA